MKPVTKLERIKKYKFVYFQRYRALVISIFGIWALYPYPYSYWTRSLCPYFSRNMPFDCLLKTEKQYNSGKNHMKIVWHHSNVFATGGGEGREGSRGSCTPSPTKKKKKKSIFKTCKLQQFQFQTSGILFLAGVQKLCSLGISWFLPCMLQSFDDLWQLFIVFSLK